MGDFVVFLLRASVIMSFVLAGLAAFVLLLNMMISLINVTLNNGVLSDIFALVGIWLPFNLSPVWYWLQTAATAFLLYRLALISYTWLNRVVSQNN